jgi:hypothetical protein
MLWRNLVEFSDDQEKSQRSFQAIVCCGAGPTDRKARLIHETQI